MKNILLICFAVSCSLNAQYYKSFNYRAVKGNKNSFFEIDSFAINNNLSGFEIKRYNYSKKGRVNSSDIIHQTFDNSGHKINLIIFSDTLKRKINYQYQVVFDPKQNIVNSVINENKSIQQRQSIYNDSNQIITLIYFFNNRLSTTTHYEYNAFGLLSSLKVTDSKNKVLYKYEYSYYDNKDKKQIKLFDKKGNIKRVWDYSCENTGKVVKKSTDTSKVCVLKSYLPDGSIVSTTHYFDYKNNPIKEVVITNAQKQIIERSYYKGINDELFYKNTFIYQGEDMIKQTSESHKKGKLFQSFVITYNLLGHITSQSNSVFHKNEAKVYSTNYSYDASGLITKIVKYLNNQVIEINLYNFTYFKKG